MAIHLILILSSKSHPLGVIGAVQYIMKVRILVPPRIPSKNSTSTLLVHSVSLRDGKRCIEGLLSWEASVSYMKNEQNMYMKNVVHMAGLPGNHELSQRQDPSITTSKTQAIPIKQQLDLLALAQTFPL